MNPDWTGNVTLLTLGATGRSLWVSLSGAFQTSPVIHIHIVRTHPHGDEPVTAERPVMTAVINDTISVTDSPSTLAPVLRLRHLVSIQIYWHS